MYVLNSENSIFFTSDPTQMQLSHHKIRDLFTKALSKMYQQEVPQYQALFSLVNELNKTKLATNSVELEDETERHGAIRLGTAQELSMMRRLFAVMGMYPVDYYDLSVAGIPVHSTAFRAVNLALITKSPFRVFTSLLRLDLISDEALRQQAEQILAKRQIFSDDLVALIERSENQGALTENEAQQFVVEAIETFRWHQNATVEKPIYDALNQSHRLIADIVSFKGPHINHLTPRTLDIDAVQDQMIKRGFKAKAIVEGPPLRKFPILLRQTSFIALEEGVVFTDGKGGTHTARFGEIEQRGIALTPKGRELYDRLLQQVKAAQGDYQTALTDAFTEFPDDQETMRKEGLAYYQYEAETPVKDTAEKDLEQLIANGNISVKPIIYEDFLPVSAAGIFQSNLSDAGKEAISQSPQQTRFEQDLGAKVLDSFSLYEAIQRESLESALKALNP